MYMSEKQKEALEMIEHIKKLGEKRAFTLCELPGITRHTTNALHDKGFLKVVCGPFGDCGPEYYVRTDKELELNR